MPGDADEPAQAFVAGLGQRLDRTARPEGDVPLLGLDEVVQLDEVDLVDPQAGRASASSWRAPSVPARSPVLVARKTRCGWSASHGASRSSESPYPAAVSMWLTPAASTTAIVASARSWLIAPRAAAPKIARVD